MSASALLLVLGAAAMHAGWNALAKRTTQPLIFLGASVTLGTAVLIPPAAWIVAREGFAAAAVPFVITTVVVHVVYFYALARAYREADYSLVYPIARGLGVALVPIFALPLLGERLSLLGACGVGLVVLGIAAVRLTAGGDVTRGASTRAGTLWAVLTGLTIATYSLNDKVGVMYLHPVPYITCIGLGLVLFLAPRVIRDPTALRREWAANWRTIVVASTMNLTGYLLVLFAFRLSKVGYVVAAREVSIVISALIGSLWLKEAPLSQRLPGALLVLSGVVCVALAR